MKPVYETESRSSNRWVVPKTWAFGVFLALSFCGMAVAQVAVQPTPPVATPPHPPIVVPSAAPIRLTQSAPITASPDAAVVIMASPAPPAMKWEYKFAGDRQQLAELGKESWELVAVTQPVNGAPTFYLKRPLRDDTAADSNRGEGKNSGQSELRQERIAALKAVVELGVKLTTVGHFEIRDVSEARMTLLNAELDAAEQESDRIALYKEALDSLKQYEALAKAAKEAAKATELDKLAIKARRLEVEIWLEQATTKTAK